MTADSATSAACEAAAVKITNWAPPLVPGLVQTMDFTRACMAVYQLLSDVVLTADLHGLVAAIKAGQSSSAAWVCGHRYWRAASVMTSRWESCENARTESS